MNEMIKVDVPFKPPESIFTLCQDVMTHGVIYLLVPPQEMLLKWIEEDGLYKDNVEKREKFVKYWNFDCDLLNENDGVREEAVVQYEEDKEKPDDILPFLQMFNLAVQEKVIMMVMEKCMPLFTIPQDEDVHEEYCESIAESIEKLQPLNKATDLSQEISDMVFDLLTSIKIDLESDTAKKVLSTLTETEDVVDVEFSTAKEELEKKHRYQEIAVKEAQKQLLPIFEDKLDGIMEELCEYLRSRIYSRVEEMFIEDRENLPGPGHME
jgi:hypothetical protein